MRSSVLNHGSVWASFGPWAAARAPTTLHTRRALLLLLLVLLSHPMGTAAHLADTQQIAAEVLTRLHRCSGTRSTYCVDYFTQPYVWLKPPPVLNRPCPNNCSHLGVCHGDTGRCDCPAGVGGLDCGSPDPRPCTNRYRADRTISTPASHIGPNKRDLNWSAPGSTNSRCAGVCDDATAMCFCDGPHVGRVPAPEGSPLGTPPIRQGRLLLGACQRLTSDDKGAPLAWGGAGRSYDDIYGAQGWCTVDTPRVRCSCDVDGFDGQLCEVVTETVCPNQCSGHGTCSRGFCACFPGWYGLDCAHLADPEQLRLPQAAAAAAEQQQPGSDEGGGMPAEVLPAPALPRHVAQLRERPHLANLTVDIWARLDHTHSDPLTTHLAPPHTVAASEVSLPPLPDVYRAAADADELPPGADKPAAEEPPPKDEVGDAARRLAALQYTARASRNASQPASGLDGDRRVPRQQRALQRHFWTGGGSQRSVVSNAPRQRAVAAAVSSWLAANSSTPRDGASLAASLVASGVRLERLGSASDVEVLQHMVEGALGRLPPGASRAPRIYVYDMPSRFVGRLLQYRPSKQTCTWRIFSKSNFTLFSATEGETAWRYPLESHLHELLLQSHHRTLDPAEADFFYVPVYAACFMEAVAGWADTPWWHVHSASLVKQGVLMYADALDWVRTTYPYWNASGGADHIWLFAHDEGACWAPAELYDASIILTHWGRLAPPSPQHGHVTDSLTSRWEYNYNKPDSPVDPAGPAGGYTSLIRHHACYTPGKDLVLPTFKPPPRFAASPFMGGDSRRSRDIALLLRTDLGAGRPAAYSGGLRQQLARLAADGNWKAAHGIWVGTERQLEGDGSQLLARSRFCLVVPRDGWSGLFEDAVLHGCIPMVVLPPGEAGLAQPFSALLRLSGGVLKVAASQLASLPAILAGISADEEDALRRQLASWWSRMAWLSHPWVRAQAAAVVDDNLRQHPWVQDALEEQALQQQLAQRRMGNASTPPMGADSGVDNTTALFDVRVWGPDAPVDDAFTTLLQWLHYKMRRPFHAPAREGAPRGTRKHRRPVGGNSAKLSTEKKQRRRR